MAVSTTLVPLPLEFPASCGLHDKLANSKLTPRVPLRLNGSSLALPTVGKKTSPSSLFSAL